MLLEVAIIISSVTIGITAITLGSLNFARKIIKTPKEEEFLERFEKLKVLQSKTELLTCPLCNVKHDQKAKSIPSGSYVLDQLKDKKAPNSAMIKFSDTIDPGTSSGVSLSLSKGNFLWQCCSRCGGEWLLER